MRSIRRDPSGGVTLLCDAHDVRYRNLRIKALTIAEPTTDFLARWRTIFFGCGDGMRTDPFVCPQNSHHPR